MLEADPAADREDRRARAGYVAPSAARAFLALARKIEVDADVDALLQAPTRDPITRAFFREYKPEPLEGRPSAEPSGLRELLELAGEAEARPLLEAAPEAEPSAPSLLTRALVELAERDAQCHGQRIAELGYLANVLLAGEAGPQGRLRHLDAAQAALEACDRGLTRALARGRDDRGLTEVERAARLLERVSCDGLFRIASRQP
jgi:hypothetical protein